ncbi:GyrI-like domain-containing protein [Gracilibacillus xinjiangensis]|uniref:GyrI-like domain-containing protein n=1 Tax=Gracilibacillus xinjiangensis TaxID=1193282 RepID=A0ABV8WVW4_9BACI
MEKVTLDQFTVAGMIIKSDWKGLHYEMPKKWTLFREKLSQIINRKSDKMMDISMHYEDGIYTQCICVEVDDSFKASELEIITIPSQSYLHYLHQGEVTEIAHSFGKMIEYAKMKQIPIDHMKVDIGYTYGGNEKVHDLYIKVVE